MAVKFVFSVYTLAASVAFYTQIITIPCYGQRANRWLNLGYLVPWERGPWPIGRYIGSAFLLGLETVDERGVLDDSFDVSWTFDDTECDPVAGVRAGLRLRDHNDGRLDGIVGGGCSIVCEPLALLCSVWNVAFVSFGCSSEDLLNRYRYPTFSRTISSWISVAPLLDQLANQYRWQRVCIVATRGEKFMQLTALHVANHLVTHNKVAFLRHLDPTMDGSNLIDDGMEKIRKLIRAMRTKAMVYYLFLYDKEMLNFLYAAHEEGLYDGHHAFVGLGVIFNASDVPAHLSHHRDIIPLLYHGVLLVESSTPVGHVWQNFTHRVIDAFKHPDFANFSHVINAEKIDGHAGLLHDAVLQWAYGIRRTLDNGQPLNGISVTDSVRYLQFEGVSGVVKRDYHGERIVNYTINIIQDNTAVKLLDYFSETEQMSPHSATVTWMARSVEPPSGEPACGWKNENCPPKTHVVAIAVSTCVLGAIVGSVVLVIGIAYRHLSQARQVLAVEKWRLNWKDVAPPDKMLHLSASKEAHSTYSDAATTMGGRSTVSNFTNDLKRVHHGVACFRGTLLAVKIIDRDSVDVHEKWLLHEIKQMRELSHENLDPFIGVCVDAPHVCIAMAYATKGQLYVLLRKYDDNELNLDFRISLLTDIVKGMEYLHNSSLGSHGRLSSWTCVIDNRWVCKVTDYGLGSFRKCQDHGIVFAKMLWTAPELLRLTYDKYPIDGTKEGDVYSFAIIMYEVLSNLRPYQDEFPSDVIGLVTARTIPVHRPSPLPAIMASNGVGHKWRHLVESCWNEDPMERPTFKSIKASLKDINSGVSVDPIESSIKMLEWQSFHLENVVQQRTKEIFEKKHRTELILCNLLPRPVAVQLMLGNRVPAELFENVTVFFSDIVDFTQLTYTNSSPLQMVQLMTSLHTLFDAVTDNYDVYKVMTVSDKYMMVSGLPIPNGIRHASEIAVMALHLLSSVSSFEIPHLPGRQLQLRCGIHSGPVVAGVVGQRMPVYSIFGDTVNTAARIQSSSTALRVQISESTENLLQTLPTGQRFDLEYRGYITAKGKGQLKTFWVNGKEDFSLPLPDLTRAAPLDEHEFK